jgi:hypothetical protein
MNKITTLGLLLAGCSGSDGDAGIWAFELPYDDEYACEEVITHNFSNGYVSEDALAGDWTTDATTTLSPQLVFGQLETSGSGEGFLIIGTEAYPGVETDSGWKFSWVGSYDSSETSSHTAGYDFSASVLLNAEVSITMKITDAVATGTWSSLDTIDNAWTESDTWDNQAVGLPNGQIPSAQYLVHDFTEGKGKSQISIEGAPLPNTGIEAECSGTCELAVTSSCTGSVDFTASEVDFEDESAYQYLDRTGQEPGL